MSWETYEYDEVASCTCGRGKVINTDCGSSITLHAVNF